MREFQNILEIADLLLGPNGCSWDREQTLFSLQPYLLEEMHELIEAIDSLDGSKMAEELGDVLYALVFVAKLGEKEDKFQLADAIEGVCQKLIRRHPHVFGNVKATSSEEIINNWEEIKKLEFKERKNILDGIPLSLPSLARAQKIIQKIRRSQKKKIECAFQTEEELGEKFWELLEAAESKGWNAEDVLRRVAARREEAFRQNEKTPETGS
jgi:uncharacterized protein YabN with tetrapyrrole methylase and pyrophosphatase domain